MRFVGDAFQFARLDRVFDRDIFLFGTGICIPNRGNSNGVFLPSLHNLSPQDRMLAGYLTRWQEPLAPPQAGALPPELR